MATLDNIINSDPILRLYLREKKLDANHMQHQLEVKAAAFRIALGRWLAQFK